MIGSSAAALIGLMFVVVTLTAGRALLLISIHNEWDLVTFLAPDAQPLPASNQADDARPAE